MLKSETKNDPLYLVYKQKSGNIKTLESKLGERSVRQLEATGYISIVGDMWYATGKAEQIGRLKYKRRSLLDILIDWIFFKVLKVNLKIN